MNELKHNVLIGLAEHKTEFDNRSDYQVLLDKLDELISQMHEKRRVVFIKKKIEEKSLKEIAEELNITTKTVEYHIYEAMIFIKSKFKNRQINSLVLLTSLFINCVVFTKSQHLRLTYLQSISDS